jgi:hypothetical protein
MPDLPNVHPTFGCVLSDRRQSSGLWYAAAVTGLIGCWLLLPLTGFTFDIDAWAFRTAPAPSTERWIAGVLLIAVGVATALRAGGRFMFYERGALMQKGRRTVEIAYHELQTFKHEVRRNHTDGAYIGTTIDLYLLATDGRSIRLFATHREQLKRFSLMRSEFRGRDELDTVLGIIANTMADTVQAQVLTGHHIRWGKCATVSLEGLVPDKGPDKGKLVPWREIVAHDSANGILRMLRHGDSKPFLEIEMKADNFWPHFEVVRRMIHLEHPAAALPIAA